MSSPVQLVREDNTSISFPDDLLVAGWNGAATSTANYGAVSIAFANITGGDSYVVNGSLNGVTFKAMSAINLADFTTPASIIVDGIYAFTALGSISYTKTGSASTPTVNLLLKR